MTITLHFVRHAQGFHNLNRTNQQIPDADLTPTGTAQCAVLAASFPHHERITHLVASPMRRTLLTCHLSFPQPEPTTTKKIIAQPLIQEVSRLPCDTGSAPAVLQAEFGAWADLSLVEPGWNDKVSPGSPWAPRVEALEERARMARCWLRDMGRKWVAVEGNASADIVVVTHGGFLHFLTQDWEGMAANGGTAWDNTEYRSYEFDEPEGDDMAASIHETEASWRRRRGSALPISGAEQERQRALVLQLYKDAFDP